MKKLLVLILASFTLFQCAEKEEPQPIEGPVSFILSGQLGNEEFLLEAGKEGYFANTSVSEDAYGQRWFEGSFENLDHPSDSLSFAFRFRDLNESTSPQDPVSSLSPGLVGASSLDTTDLYIVSFNSQNQSTAGVLDSVIWDFGDGISGLGDNVDHSYPSVDQNYLVRMQSYFAGTCSAVQEYLINPSYPGKIWIELEQLGTGIWQVSAKTSGMNTVSYKWNFESGISGSTSKVVFSTQGLATTENICLEVTDSDQRKYYFCQRFEFGNLDGCIANFTHDSRNSALVSNGPSDQRVLEIEVEKSGESWTSSTGNGSIVINSSRKFGTDRDGNTTWQLDIEGNIVLQDGRGNQLTLTIRNSRIVVGSF